MLESEVSRRSVLGGSLAVTALGLAAPPAFAVGERDVARTRYGRVRGRREDGIVKFLGVPYAAPPVGRLRFRAPKEPTAWRGVREAVEFPNPAYQATGAEMGPTGNGRMPAPSEDCLYLNVWTPAAD